jgi:hypothetical protein
MAQLKIEGYQIMGDTCTLYEVKDNDELKNICQIEHSRHRSFKNFVTNLIAGLIAYCFLPKKPAIKYQTSQKTNQLELFY